MNAAARSILIELENCQMAESSNRKPSDSLNLEGQANAAMSGGYQRDGAANNSYTKRTVKHTEEEHTLNSARRTHIRMTVAASIALMFAIGVVGLLYLLNRPASAESRGPESTRDAVDEPRETSAAAEAREADVHMGDESDAAIDQSEGKSEVGGDIRAKGSTVQNASGNFAAKESGVYGGVIAESIPGAVITNPQFGPFYFGSWTQGPGAIPPEGDGGAYPPLPPDAQLARLLLVSHDEGIRLLMSGSADEARRTWLTVIDRGEKAERESPSLEVQNALSVVEMTLGIYYVLQRDWDQALHRFDNAVGRLEVIAEADPAWQTSLLPEAQTPLMVSPTSPPKFRALSAELGWAFVAIMDLNARPHAKRSEELGRRLATIRNAVEREAGGIDDKWAVGYGLAATYYAKGDCQAALDALEFAAELSGSPEGPETLSEQQCMMQFQNWALRVALLANLDRLPEAGVALDSAEKFAAGIKGDFNGMLGTLRLICAEAQPDPQKQFRLLQTARRSFSGHMCPSCFYGDACAAGRMADLEEQQAPLTEERKVVVAGLRRDAAAELIKALVAYTYVPFEIDLDSVRRDPRLKSVISDPNVVALLESFVWHPDLRGGIMPPEFLWHHLPPLKLIRFPHPDGASGVKPEAAVATN